MVFRTIIVILLVGLATACSDQPRFARSTPGSIVEIEVTRELEALAEIELKADRFMEDFREEVQQAYAENLMPDFVTAEDKANGLREQRLKLKEKVEANKLPLLEPTFARLEKSHSARLLEVRGRRLVFDLNSLQDLLSEMKTVSSRSAKDDGLLDGILDPPTDEERAATVERLRRELGDTESFVKMHLELMEALAADSLLANRLYVPPRMVEVPPSSVSVGGKRDQNLVELIERANEDGQFDMLFQVKTQMENLLGSDYYFTLGEMDFLEPDDRQPIRDRMSVFRGRVQALAQRFKIETALADLTSLTDLID